MQQKDYQPLCDAIRQKCADQHWYGAELQSPENLYDVAVDDPRRSRFEFSPATEEQIQETEAILGFPLPAVLHALYSQVANGGFGPGCGLLGAVEGASLAGETLATSYQFKREKYTLFDLEGIEIREGKDFTFVDSLWPRFLLPFCNWGCGVHIGLDSLTGHILRIGPLEKAYCLTPVAASLEEWLDQ